MPTPEEQKAQEAEAAAQVAAAAAQAEQEAETTEQPPPLLTDDPKVLRAELERTRKEAAAQRVKLRELNEAKRKADEAALAEKGQFRELAESRGKDLEATRQELEQLRVRTATFEKREAEEQQRREAQVAAEFAQLPEEIRSEFPQDADLHTKEIAVRTYAKASGKAPPRPPTTPSTAPKSVTPIVEAPISEQQERMYAQIVGNGSLPREKREAAQAKLNELKAWRQQNPGR